HDHRTAAVDAGDPGAVSVNQKTQGYCAAEIALAGNIENYLNIPGALMIFQEIPERPFRVD
ncbi:hypothetical protein, partial [Atlantibacter subterraneus]|uniref:hypothetical protein n=1 Tax=Atlantibacter subterraneus TaxID=255519 RepID=UPI002FDC9EC9